MTICERMFEIMTKKGLKSVDLAEHIQVNSGQVSTWKKRNTDPPSKYISSICEFLAVDTSYLLTGIDTCQDNMEINANDQELLDLFHQLPDRNQIKLIGYVERMVEELFGETISTNKNSKHNYDWVDWDKLANEERSVAADEPLKKTGTDNLGK
ncbi:MAG: helix-turn-helix domain-containing protein [Lachnospiraceae bacterium]|nr:helix-turn-helix domain-containing protein [Lachnospiraceae bacterium]